MAQMNNGESSGKNETDNDMEMNLKLQDYVGIASRQLKKKDDDFGLLYYSRIGIRRG